MTTSYWGVEHGDTVSKAYGQPQQRRNRDSKAAGVAAGLGGYMAGAEIGSTAANYGRGGKTSGGIKGAYKAKQRIGNAGAVRNVRSTQNALMGGAKPVDALKSGVSAQWKTPGFMRTAKGGVAGGLATGGLAYAGLQQARRKPVAKAEKSKYGKYGPPSPDRRMAAGAANYLLPGSHGAVAGRRGKKLRAFGNEGGGQVLGALAGGGAGAAIGGRFAAPVGLAGAVTGGQMGLNRNQRKGYLKPEKRN